MGVDFLQEWHWEALSVMRYLHGLKGFVELETRDFLSAFFSLY